MFVSYPDRLTIDMTVYRTDGIHPDLPSIHMEEEKHFLPILGIGILQIEYSSNFDAEAISK